MAGTIYTERPLEAPDWAEAKIRFYLATCWAADIDTYCPEILGINWMHDKLFFACACFHRLLVQPFFPDREGFPFTVLEVYTD